MVVEGADGRDEAAAASVDAITVPSMGVAVEGNFNENTLLNPVRAPRVLDYLDGAAATDLKLRALNSVLRVNFQAQMFFAPR